MLYVRMYHRKKKLDAIDGVTLLSFCLNQILVLLGYVNSNGSSAIQSCYLMVRTRLLFNRCMQVLSSMCTYKLINQWNYKIINVYYL